MQTSISRVRCSAGTAGHVARVAGPVRATAQPLASRTRPVSRRQAVQTQAQGLETPTVAAMSVVAEAVTQAVTTLTAHDFNSFLEEAGSKLVIVDFYTDWCGPCKMIAPQVEKMAQEYDPSSVLFAKFNCGVDNDSKKLAVALGIKALPTFHLYREAKVQSQMTGAKLQSLQDLVNKHL